MLTKGGCWKRLDDSRPEKAFDFNITTCFLYACIVKSPDLKRDVAVPIMEDVSSKIKVESGIGTFKPCKSRCLATLADCLLF